MSDEGKIRARKAAAGVKSREDRGWACGDESEAGGVGVSPRRPVPASLQRYSPLECECWSFSGGRDPDEGAREEKCAREGSSQPGAHRACSAARPPAGNVEQAPGSVLDAASIREFRRGDGTCYWRSGIARRERRETGWSKCLMA